MRVVPASPSYFTAVPRFTDDLLRLTSLLGRYKHLPMYARGEVPKVAWKSTEQYASEIQEPIKSTRFARLMRVIKRLNMIHASLMPQVILSALQRYKRVLQPFASRQKPLLIDEWGRSRGVGRRKSSNAHCYVVEGEGEIRVNGKTLTEYFNRVQDRESVIWALRATQRTDKYNVWAIAQGGGTTGQAEAVMLGVAKALLAHEPALKPALRRGMCVVSVYMRHCANCSFQLAVLSVTLVAWRERSRANSRQERCPLGSSDSLFLQSLDCICIYFCVPTRPPRIGPAFIPGTNQKFETMC